MINECILCRPSEPTPAIRTDVPFGDGKGTIGYINEFGELISIVQMLDFGPTGLVQLRPNIEDDFFTDEVNRLVDGHSPGIGLRVADRHDLDHKLYDPIEFVHDKWPRVRFRELTVDVTVQWAIVDKRVVQDCILENKTKDVVCVEMVLDLGMSLSSPYMGTDELCPAIEFDTEIFTVKNTCIVLSGGVGGYVRLRASLFEDDGRPVLLQPGIKEATSEDDEKGEKPAKSNGLRTIALIHVLPVKLEAGEKRQLTAVYEFASERWSRSQVYDMKFIKTTPDTPANARREMIKDQRCLEEYKKAFSENDVGGACRILENGPAEPEADPSDSGQKSHVVDSINADFSLDTSTEDETERKPYFRNWGGEALSSHFLLGREWNIRHRPPVQLGSYEDIDKYIAWIDEIRAREEARKVAARAEMGTMRSKLMAEQGASVPIF